MADPVPRRVLDAIPDTRQAIDHLRTTEHAPWADAVQLVADYAQATAARAIPADTPTGPGRNRILETTATIANHIRQAADAAGDKVSAVVIRRYQEYVDGLWTPTPPPRAAAGTRGEPGKLNFRVPDELWEQVKERGRNPELNEGRKITPLRVALMALVEEFGAGQLVPEHRVEITPWVTIATRDAIHEAASAAGTDVHEVARRHFEAFVAGEWLPTEPPRRTGWGDTKVTPFPVRIPEALHAQAEALARELVDAGRLPGRYPPMPRIALAALLDEWPEVADTLQ